MHAPARFAFITFYDFLYELSWDNFPQYAAKLRIYTTPAVDTYQKHITEIFVYYMRFLIWKKFPRVECVAALYCVDIARTF